MTIVSLMLMKTTSAPLKPSPYHKNMIFQVTQLSPTPFTVVEESPGQEKTFITAHSQHIINDPSYDKDRGGA